MRVRCNVLLKQKGKLFSSRKLCLLKILRSEAQETTSPKKGTSDLPNSASKNLQVLSYYGVSPEIFDGFALAST